MTAQAPPAKIAPAKTPAANAPTAPLPQDSLTRYGSILVPGDEATHPVRLKLPFPGVGEVKIPSPGDLTLREKLEQLAVLSDDQIHVQLEKWPAYAKMTLRDQAAMLVRIQDFRDYRAKIALQKAHDMGLLTLTDAQKKKFERDYWDKRLQMDRDLAKQFEPIYLDREQTFKDELYREYSAISAVPIAQGPKPPTPPPAPLAGNKSATPTTTVSNPPPVSPPPVPDKSTPTVGANGEPMMQH